jgi:phosphomannomutase
MALIKSISGIRGTIGGEPGEALTPLDVVKYSAAFAQILAKNNPQNKKLVIGRDGRISGPMVEGLVVNTLVGMGFHVINLGLSTTPTVEMAVVAEKAVGGIILTASHNPKEWNALKLLNEAGEFISAALGTDLLALADAGDFSFASVDRLGKETKVDGHLANHIQAILDHPLVDKQAIQSVQFSVVVDAINSSGAIAVPALLKALGVDKIKVLHAETNGQFAHNPEPLPEHLRDLCESVVKEKAHLGIAVDPDVDRLCFVCEDGSLFGEEYTLVAVADYVLQHTKGNTVSNMSSTRALKDITEKHGGTYYASAVGEVNVVEKMKAVSAVIGGEGNGGIIVPELHYGRDALIGIALFLSHLAKEKKTTKQLRNTYPDYFMSKNKIELGKNIVLPSIFKALQKKYHKQPQHTTDGLKIEFEQDWVHLRASNTEPIIRIYAESNSPTVADNIAKRLMDDIRELA